MSRPWSDEDVKELLLSSADPLESLAARFGRSPRSVESKLRQYGRAPVKPGRSQNRLDIEDTSVRRAINDRIAERDQRESLPETLDNILMGTPRKGRSARDGWVQQGDPRYLNHEAKNRPEPRKPWDPLRDGKREIAL
jgi:hypothetical protein